MDNRTPKNVIHRGSAGILLLIALLVGVSFIPPQRLCGVNLRRANILSDIITLDSPSDTPADGAQTDTPALGVEPVDEEEYAIDIEEVSEQVEAVVSQPRQPLQYTYSWDTTADTLTRGRHLPRKAPLLEQLTPIEEFDTLGSRSLRAFCDTLLTARRTVRIAVLGDSFIEGDILTADLREMMQEVYGGGGAGFAPTASPLTAFRRTIKTQSKGWTTYNIMRYKTTPEPLKSNYFVSGWVCRPSKGASTRWEATSYRRHLDRATHGRLFFTATRDCEVVVTLNDTLSRTFAIDGDAAVRQIKVCAPGIHSLEMRLQSGEEGFTGYGAQFEGCGVTVDNYSVRSNNGHAMFRTNPSVNAQIGQMNDYDLVILQYGLNIMQSGVTVYNHYSQQVEKMISFVRECFPTAAVLVMGVSDRSVKTDKGFEPMDAIPAMLKYQRQAALNTRAAFWPTAEAMHRQGGMAEFVKNGWAAKDYTHINYLGGQRIAWALFDAIDHIARQRHRIRVAQELKAKRQQMILDSIRRSKIDRQILRHDDTANKYPML